MTDINQKRKEILARFGLRDGQFFAFNRYKNLQWFLNGEFIGYGDLTTDQIINIQRELEDDERFVGHSEHYGTQFQSSNLWRTSLAVSVSTQVRFNLRPNEALRAFILDFLPRVVITPTRIYHEIEIRNLGLMS